MSPEVSVIILCYNQRDIVSRAIDSVLAQRCDFPFEIVIGDDASTDGTREICESYARRYPDIIRLMPAAPNKGVVHNYFDTLAACRGRFIADCAGDDYWLGSDSLQQKHDLLCAHPEAVIVHSLWSENEIDNVCYPDDIGSGRDMAVALLSFRHSPSSVAMHLSTTLYRADVARKCLEKDPSVVCNAGFACEDLPLMCALLMNGDAVLFPRSTLLYSKGIDSISAPRSASRSAEFQLVTSIAAMKIARHYGLYCPGVSRNIASKLYYALAMSLVAGDYSLKKRIVESVKAHSLPVSWKFRVVRILSVNRLIWRVVRKIRGR